MMDNLISTEEFLRRRNAQHSAPLTFDEMHQDHVIPYHQFAQRIGIPVLEWMRCANSYVRRLMQREDHILRTSELMYLYTQAPEWSRSRFGKRRIDRLQGARREIHAEDPCAFYQHGFEITPFPLVGEQLTEYVDAHLHIELDTAQKKSVEHALRYIYREDGETLISHYTGLFASQLCASWFDYIVAHAVHLHTFRQVFGLLEQSAQDIAEQNVHSLQERLDEVYSCYRQLP